MAPKSKPNAQRGQRKATAAEKGKRKAPPSPSHGSSSDSEPTPPRKTSRARGPGIRIGEGNTPSITTSSDFRSNSEKKMFEEEMKDRKLTKSKSIDFQYFTDEGFQFPKWLKDYGLEQFLTQKDSLYEHLVRLFFFYLKWDESIRKYTSYVQGVFIAFNVIEFCQIMQIPYESDEEEEEIDLQQQIVFLTGDRTLPPAAFHSRELKSIEYRILFNILCYCVYPRAGGYDKVTVDDMYVLYGILTGSKIGLGSSMLQYMLQQRDRTNGRLPFGTVLTRLLKHFKVDLKKEKPIKFNSYNVINESTLKRMRLVKKDGQWVDKLKDREEEEEEGEAEAEQAAAPAQGEDFVEVREVEAAQATDFHEETSQPQRDEAFPHAGFDDFSFSDLLGSSSAHQPTSPPHMSTPPQSIPQPPTPEIDFSSLISFMENQFSQLNSRMNSIETKVDIATTEIQTIKQDVANKLELNQTKMDLIESSFTQHCPPMSKSLQEIEDRLKLQQDALMAAIHSATVSLQDVRDNTDRVCLKFKLPTLPELLRELEDQVRREYKKVRASRPPPPPKKNAKPKYVPKKRRPRSPSQSPPHSPAHVSESGDSNQPRKPKPEPVSSNAESESDSSHSSEDGSYNSDPTY